MPTHPPAADHPLCRELALVARRAEPDLVLKARFLGLRREVMGVVGRRVPGLIARLVADETARLADTVLTECRQWAEAGEWADHRRHLEAMRAAASCHLWLSTAGADIARAHDSPPVRFANVQRYSGAE